MKSCPECYSEYDDAQDICPDDNTALRVIERDPLVGQKLSDRYEVVSVIGRGGMGVVYKVRQEYMDRYMAIKMLHSHMVADSEAVKRFFREAKTVSQVKHHHIITLYDFGMSKLGQPYLVMDYLEGVSLKTEIKDNGPVSIERAANIYAQVCDALASAHSVNLVHRDLKPENIMLSVSGGMDDWVTLVDFGLSKLRDTKKEEENLHITKVGDVCGSPPYMSPEQCLSSLIVDPRSDIYSLAICVYETLSAKLPYNAKSAIELLDCHLYATPIPFNQSAPEFKMCSELTHVLSKALQKDPEKRHQTIEEFGNEFRDACRRDALKFRTAKHRVEVSSFSDLKGEAEAIRQKSLVESRNLKAAEVPEGIQFSTTAVLAEAAKGTQTDGKNGHPEKQESPSWLNVLRSKVGGPRKSTLSDAAIAAASAADLAPIAGLPGTELVENCPYCHTKTQLGIKFCVNCQHQLLTVHEASKLRTSNGLYTVPQKGLRGTENLNVAFTSRAKNSLNSGMDRRSIEKVLGLATAALVLASGVWGYLRWSNSPLTNIFNAQNKVASSAAPAAPPAAVSTAAAPKRGSGSRSSGGHNRRH
ncbi:MAG: serine/threonine-protein kinase [Candidatus Obscuribacterales bacterium]|nr:serine/threonine-protein kinase [Candidatus Obscuribacterales bacterium]